MKIIEHPQEASELLRRAKAHRPKRSEGWHTTDHTKCLRKTIYGLVTGRDIMDGDEHLTLRLIRGEGLGAFFSENQEEWRFYAPGFGWCSIDRPWGWKGTVVPMELKSTRMSSAYAITDEDSATVGYISQVITYLTKSLFTRTDDRSQIDYNFTWADVPDDAEYSCLLYVLYEMGDWSKVPADHRMFEIQLTGAELKIWDRELDRRHQLLVESLNGFNKLVKEIPEFQQELDKMGDFMPTSWDLEPILPPVEEHYSWECSKYGEGCPIKDVINCPGGSHNASWGLPPFKLEEHYARENKVRKGAKKK